jgi:Domain of unknown function (DUF3471)/Domain of unknown function (DUF4440)
MPALLIGLALGTGTITDCAAAPAPSDELFGKLILQRVQAHSRGEATGYRQLLADDFVHVDDTGKRRTVDEIGAIIGAGNRSRWEVGKVHARRIGDSLAIVDCEVTEFVSFGPRELRMPLHETDVFVLRGDSWLFLEHAETHALDTPRPVTPNSAGLDDYVGRYECWPGYGETFTRSGDQLYGQATGDKSPAPLRAATNESFFVEGDPGLIVFVRGANGKVTHELIHFPDGKVLVARKIKAAE